jgi:hypothetical protein
LSNSWDFFLTADPIQGRQDEMGGAIQEIQSAGSASRRQGQDQNRQDLFLPHQGIVE